MIEAPVLAVDLAAGIREPRLRRFYEYWLARKGSRRWPARRDIDPLDFPYLLGHILLVDVLEAPLRFRVRLHGTHMVERAQYDLTGKLIDELPINDYRAYVMERCRKLVATGEPVIVHHDRTLDGRTRCYEALWLPFSEDGVRVTMLLAALIYDWERQ